MAVEVTSSGGGCFRTCSNALASRRTSLTRFGFCVTSHGGVAKLHDVWPTTYTFKVLAPPSCSLAVIASHSLLTPLDDFSYSSHQFSRSNHFWLTTRLTFLSWKRIFDVLVSESRRYCVKRGDSRFNAPGQDCEPRINITICRSEAVWAQMRENAAAYACACVRGPYDRVADTQGRL